MSSPSSLGEAGREISAAFAYSTSTALFFVRTSDTGTVASTSRTIDLSRQLHVGATGGKPLDTTVHRRASGPPRWKSAVVAFSPEMVFHTSGLNTYVTVAHKNRSATSGAGSTWDTIKTDVFRYKMGTDTDATFLGPGVVSSCNLQGVDRYYKANITFSWKKASSTSAKDTTTSQEMVCHAPLILLSGHEAPQVSVPYKVS